MPSPYTHWLEPLRELCAQAGAVIMEYYGQSPEVSHKEDDSPVTEADLAANQLIVERLAVLAPDIPIVSEEGDKPDISGATKFWLVDPLDGTKSFIRHEGEFTVNIGLIVDKLPVLGVIYVPALACCYWGLAGEGAWRQRNDGDVTSIRTRAVQETGLAVVASRSHFSGETAVFMDGLSIAEKVQAASSLKFCRLAEGSADLYPRFGPTMEWDTAAGHAILFAAGGRVETPDGQPFLYAKPNFLNGSFVAWGR